MSKRGENIHKRKDGRWEGRYPKHRNESGKIIYGSVYGKTYSEARKKLLSAKVGQDDVIICKHNEYRVKDLLELWLNNNRIKYKGATEARYRYLIDTHINPQLGNLKLDQLTATTINNFLLQKLENGRIDGKGGLSPAYVRSIMLIVNSAIKFAVCEGLCKPIKSVINKPILQKQSIPILTIQQQKKFEHYLWSHVDDTSLGILISLYTGLRMGEVCALKWEDLDFDEGILCVCRTVARITDPLNSKTKLIIDTPKTSSSTRMIPIPSRLLPILRHMRKKGNFPYVISKTSSFMNPRTYEYRYCRLLELAGIEHIKYHALRHTFATRCIEAGVDVKSLSEILGHSNVGITLNTYVHSSMELKRTQLEKLTILI